MVTLSFGFLLFNNSNMKKIFFYLKLIKLSLTSHILFTCKYLKLTSFILKNNEKNAVFGNFCNRSWELELGLFSAPASAPNVKKIQLNLSKLQIWTELALVLI